MKAVVSFILCCLISTFISGQEIYFPPNFSQEWETIDPTDLNWCNDNIEELNTFLEETQTNAFIILKDGKIAHEAYFNDFDLTTNWYWASAGKTMTAAMVGIVQEEGLLSIDDATSDYLGDGWTSCESTAEQKITIWNQLTMTSGLDYTVDDIYCTDPECLTCLNEPGEEWFYHNGPYTLLSSVVEAASDQNYTGATNARICNKIGFIGFWAPVGYNRLFFSPARGMARFGLLMLNNGFWQDEDIIKDKDYFNDMITTSQDINESYGYLWWLNGKESFRLPGLTLTFDGSLVPDAPDDMYAAIGANGQILMVVPSQNLIIVRMGNNPDNSLVPTDYVRDIWAEYEKLACSVNTTSLPIADVRLRSTLVENTVELITDSEVDNVIVLNQIGLPVEQSTQKSIDVSTLNLGVYFLQVKVDDHSIVRKFVKI